MNCSDTTLGIIRGHLEVRGHFVYFQGPGTLITIISIPVCASVSQMANFKLSLGQKIDYPLEIYSDIHINAFMDFMATCEAAEKALKTAPQAIIAKMLAYSCFFEYEANMLQH